MTPALYNPTSPYVSTPQISNHLPYLDFWNPQVTVLPNVNDIFFTVGKKYQHRPDLLSYDLYGTTGYWWIFAVRNPDVIQDPIYDLVAGQNIYIPPQSSLPVNGY